MRNCYIYIYIYMYIYECRQSQKKFTLVSPNQIIKMILNRIFFWLCKHSYFDLLCILSTLMFSLRNSVGVFFFFLIALLVGYFQVVSMLLDLSFFWEGEFFSRISVCIIFFIGKLYHLCFSHDQKYSMIMKN